MHRDAGREPHADSPIVQAVAPGYAFEGTALELGGLMLDATTLTSTHIRIPLGMLNRHGLVAGATGTGKTKTLQLMAEQLSTAGVPVFAADIKGDLSGLATPGEPSDKLTERDLVGRPAVDRDRVPGRVLRARRAGHRHPAPGHDVGVRPDAAEQGARPQRHPGVQPRAGLPLRRPGRAAAARPRRPARGGQVPHQRRGQGGPQEPRRPVRRHRGSHPARADRLLRPGRRRVLRRAGVRVEPTSCRPPPTARG